MEKTNKYYSIIENLVRNHKKFQGLDAILDDIIDDVYSHSEVIINSINNDSVIQAYLEKVVSTSIITVPKKMNFHSEIKHRVVSNDIIESVLPKKDTVNNDLVDKMINSMPLTSSSASIQNEAVEEQSETVISDSEADDLSLSLVEKLDNEDVNPEECVIEDNSELVDEGSLSIDDFDVSLENDNESIIEEVVSDEEEILDLGDIDENDDNSQDDVNVEKCQNELNYSEPFVADESSDVNEVVGDLPEISEDENFELIDLQQNDLDDFAVDNESEPVQDEENLDNNILETSTSDDIDFNDTDLLSDDSPLDIIDDSLNDIADSITTTLEQNSHAQDVNNNDLTFKPIDYSVFNFTPKEDNGEILVVDEVKQELLDLDAKHPELQITNVYNLKFKDKNSIEEITSKLGMTQEQVIEALNEMIAVV